MNLNDEIARLRERSAFWGHGQGNRIADDLHAAVAVITRQSEMLARCREVLERTVDVYGKPGGPWNVPGDPGGWLCQARDTLAALEEAEAQARHLLQEGAP